MDILSLPASSGEIEFGGVASQIADHTAAGPDVTRIGYFDCIVAGLVADTGTMMWA